MSLAYRVAGALGALLALAGCGGATPGVGGSPQPSLAQARRPGTGCAGSAVRVPPGMPPAAVRGVTIARGFTVETIAKIPAAREIAALPDGDLIVGTLGNQTYNQYYILPDAEAAGAAGSPRVFATIHDKWAAGVAFAADRCVVLFGTEYGVWSTPYKNGDLQAERVTKIASLRSGPVVAGTDGDVHVTTSLAYANGIVYAAAGSSCNASADNGVKPCTETDPTRAAISQMSLDGTGLKQRAHKMRNAIALAIDAQTGALWAGGAGQDDLPAGHPYEYLDDVSAHPGDPSYGWPECEENHVVYWSGYNCSSQVVPSIELPAYSTIVGAVFYPLNPALTYAFPPQYRGSLFATTHGSWHRAGNTFADPPRVVFVPMRNGAPAKPVDWNDPAAQWSPFLGGFQPSGYTRTGRPTGIAVGSKGSLFVADDYAGVIYRIRPVASNR